MAELALTHPRTSELTRRLASIADEVSTHIAIENMILAECDQATLSSAWREVWEDGKEGFRALCADWATFLGEWNADCINADLAGFRQAATDVLGRLRERTQAESRSFYLIALQTSVVAFR